MQKKFAQKKTICIFDISKTVKQREMIKGFEDITYNLTQYEKEELLPRMVEGLTRCIGEKKAVTNKKMIAKLKKEGLKASEARIRKVISYIRINKLVKNLISNSKGYFVATNQQQIDDYVQSLFEREMAIKAIRKSFG